MKASLIALVPEETVRIACAALPKGNLYLLMRDELGIAFSVADFAELFPRRGTVRRARYKGLQKTHLQETATAAGINILRTIKHFTQVPAAKTCVSRFARLAH